MKIYFDNCCYNRPFDNQNQMRIYLESQAKIYIQGLILDKKIELACSYMSLFENNDNPHDKNKAAIGKFLRNASEYIAPDKVNIVEAKAADIIRLKIAGKDAIHLACAITANCDYFITTDDGIIKRYDNTEILVCGPVDFVKIMEEHNA
jgi:predicted nucleic acid-binding protein